MTASNMTIDNSIAGMLLFCSIATSAFAAEEVPLAKLTITGVTGELKAGLEKHLPVSQPVCTASKSEVSDYFQSLKTSLRKGGRALGYYDAVFTSGGKEVNNCWEMTLDIKPGEPVRVVSQFIEVKGAGADETLFRQAMLAPPYKQGDILNHQLYDDFKTQITEAAETLGYLDAVYEQKAVTVDPLAFQARVNLVMNTGQRYTFGDITVEQDVLGDNLITRFIKIKPGTPFSTESVIEQQQAFQRSGYYSSVNVDVDIKGAKNRQIPVTIKLIRAKRDKYRYKVGYGTDTGPRVKAELQRRWTGEKGRKVEASAQWAQTLSQAKFELIEPRENPDFDSLSYLVEWTYDTADDIESQSFEFGADYKRKVDSGWEQGLFVNTLIDRTTADGDSPDDSILTLVGGRLSKTKINSESFTTSGWNIKLQAQGALNNVLSDQSVAQFEVNTKYIFPIGKGRLVNRMDIGITDAGDLEDLPKKLRFFAGGGSSVRGYDFESIGETNSSGSVIGGKNLFAGSIEYEHPIKDAWSVAAFLDAGDAFNDWDDVDLQFGIGGGVRYRSPIGPVRVDIGFPDGEFGEATFHLSVGPDL
jgi:translocation and assembly module TamA